MKHHFPERWVAIAIIFIPPAILLMAYDSPSQWISWFHELISWVFENCDVDFCKAL